MISKATLAGIGALALWSALALLAVRLSHLPPFQIIAIGFGVAAILSILRWLWRRENILARLRQPTGAWLLGVGGLFGYHFCYFLALNMAPPVQANLVNYLWPLLIVLFSALLPGQRLGARHVAGALMGFAGAGLLVAGNGLDAVDAAHLPGYGLALACALIWSGYSVANRRYADVPTDAVGGFCAAAALLALASHLAFERAVWPDPLSWGLLLAMGLGPLGAAFFLWDHGTKRGDIRLLGNLAYVTPLASTILLVLFGRGDFDWNVAAAAALIVAGAAIGTLPAKPATGTLPAKRG